MITAPSDLARLLRSTADWFDGGGNVELILWGVIIVFGIWMVLDIWTLFARGQRRKRKPPSGATVGYATASVIANGYIDPDNTGRDGVRIAVRSQILKKFEDVPGAKVGDEYNADLLHRWLQKNAARALVKHQSEIR